MKKTLLQFLLLALFLKCNILKAQVPLNYVFSQDSLTGFDENGTKNIAISKHLVGQEFKYFMYKTKREFINHKFHLAHDNEIVWKTLQTATVQPACSNVDFENGTLSGWTVSNGGNNNSLTMAGCCPTPGAGVANVINGIGTDPLYTPLSLVSPFGGNKIVKLNNTTAGNKSQRISQTFNVTSSNAIFQIAYSGLLNSGGHDCFEQPYINISVKDSSGTDLSCPKIEIQAPDPNCIPTSSAVTAGWNYTGFDNAGGAVYYHLWEVKTVDLSPYIGSNITVQITVGDCIYSAHYGYAYFDCRCLPLEIDLNGTIFDATAQTPIDVSTCGSGTASINAPTGLGPYLWNGPAGSGVSGVTTQSLSATSAGTYTLTMSPTGGCFGPTTKYMILHITPNPTVTNVTSQATCSNATGSGTVSVSSGTSPFTFNWNPTASNDSTATGLSPGVDYTVTVVDTFGCQSTTILSIASFTDAPTYTINPLNANLSCASPSLMVTATTAANTTAVWTHTSSVNFVATAAGSYSCIVTNTTSSCTATVPITITSNTIAPVATPSLICNGSTVTLNATSSAGIALGWLAPTAPPSPVSNPGTSTANGTFTLTATNLSTGCKTTYTVQSLRPDLTIATTPGTNLTCITQSLQSVATTTSTSVTLSWFDGVTTTSATANTLPLTINSNGVYTITAVLSAGCSTQSVVTITTNTAVGVFISTPSTVISCATNSLALAANGTTSNPYSFVWMPSSPTYTNSTYNVSDAGTYTVIGLNSVNGCTASATKSVTHETVTASFSADPYQGLMPLPVTFTNTSFNALNYTWDLANGNVYTTTNASTIYESQGSYSVILTAVNGFCIDTAVRIIKVELVSSFKIPNVFTPNGDGKNDVFILDAVNMGQITLSVFDRWGLKIFESTADGNVKWDGKNKGGSTVAAGTYFYIIKGLGLDDVKYDLQGTITVFH